MIAPLDVFRIDNRQVSSWIAKTTSLLDAIEIVKKRGPGRYLIFSEKSECRRLYEVKDDGHVAFKQREWNPQGKSSPQSPKDHPGFF